MSKRRKTIDLVDRRVAVEKDSQVSHVLWRQPAAALTPALLKTIDPDGTELTCQYARVICVNPWMWGYTSQKVDGPCHVIEDKATSLVNLSTVEPFTSSGTFNFSDGGVVSASKTKTCLMDMYSEMRIAGVDITVKPLQSVIVGNAGFEQFLAILYDKNIVSVSGKPLERTGEADKIIFNHYYGSNNAERRCVMKSIYPKVDSNDAFLFGKEDVLNASFKFPAKKRIPTTLSNANMKIPLGQWISIVDLAPADTDLPAEGGWAEYLNQAGGFFDKLQGAFYIIHHGSADNNNCHQFVTTVRVHYEMRNPFTEAL